MAPVGSPNIVPSVIGMLVQSLYVILDGIIVGQGIGEIALGAINVVFPFSMLVVALSMLISVGGANVYSFHKGMGEGEKANNIFCQCLAFAAAVGVILALLGFFLRDELSIFMGANEALLPYASVYMQWSAPFSLIQMVTFGLSVFVRNDDDPKIAMLGSVFGALVNAALDIIFILVLHYGIEIAALTNGVGVSIEFLFYISHFLRKKGMLRIRRPVFHFDEIKRILSNGFSSALMEFSVPAGTFSFNLAAVHTSGTLGISAYAIVSYVCAIMNMVMVGVVQGVQPIMSFYHGKGEKERFSYIYRLGARTNVIASLVLVGISSLFGREIVSLFHKGSSAELTELTVHMLRQYSPAYIVIGITLMNILYFQTTERNAHAALISFLRCIGFIQVFLLLSFYVFDARGLYLTFLAGEIFHLIISHQMVRSIIRRLRNGKKEATEVIHPDYN